MDGPIICIPKVDRNINKQFIYNKFAKIKFRQDKKNRFNKYKLYKKSFYSLSLLEFK